MCIRDSLTFALGAQGFFAIVGGALTFVVVLMGVYGLLTARAVERTVLKA